MNNVILIRFNEIHLKGGNKKYFIKLLYNNIKHALKDFSCKVETIQNRLIVRDYEDEQGIIDALKCVFGVHSISKAVELPNDVEAIKDYVNSIKIDGSFKCEVNRAEKSFPIKSIDLAADLGEIILNNNKTAKVNIHAPETIVFVDIRESGKTYVFYEITYAFSGLPLSEKRDGLLLLSGGIDSPVAGFCIEKRGLRQDILHFDSFPYT
ncbi:MAG: THUMP domain-containing protein, partial [Clostridia bacterium]|nr:THUMP domain-containing protein [Clostridia bacterium]